MIIKLHRPGRSFKGVCRYLTHDAKADTAERVVWTHTLNLANDDVNAAVDEMLWTFRAADALKREAGVSTGGSKLEKPVKHFSLSWPHGVVPTKAHMIETVQAYMEHMGWSGRQAVLVAHNDTRHEHAHVLMNSVSPEDGRAVRSSHDWRRTEAFALQYEREHGQIHCEQRLKPQDERHATPTRESWQGFKKSEIAFERAEVERLTKAPSYFERHDDKLMNSREWDALKAYQQKQREQFFVDGKEAFRGIRKDVFREVREEFRGQWNAYYAAARGGYGKTSLAETKLALTKAQNKALEERRQAACDRLREKRDQTYQVILAQQRFDRAELGKRQDQGLRTYELMDLIYPSPEPARPVQEIGREKPPWRAAEADPTQCTMKENEFDRAGQAAIDPYRRQQSQNRTRPGVVQRAETPTPVQAVDGVGRTLNESEQARARKQDETARPIEAPRAPTGEITDTASEKARSEKAREMTDQAVAKGRAGEVAALRASWNRHRRSRGSRD